MKILKELVYENEFGVCCDSRVIEDLFGQHYSIIASCIKVIQRLPEEQLEGVIITQKLGERDPYVWYELNHIAFSLLVKFFIKGDATLLPLKVKFDIAFKEKEDDLKSILDFIFLSKEGFDIDCDDKLEEDSESTPDKKQDIPGGAKLISQLQESIDQLHEELYEVRTNRDLILTTNTELRKANTCLSEGNKQLIEEKGQLSRMNKGLLAANTSFLTENNKFRDLNNSLIGESNELIEQLLGFLEDDFSNPTPENIFLSKEKTDLLEINKNLNERISILSEKLIEQEPKILFVEDIIFACRDHNKK